MQLRAASALAKRLVVDPQSIISASPGSTIGLQRADQAALRRMRPAADADARLVDQRPARPPPYVRLTRRFAPIVASRRAVSVVT
jgi:hypothetical protein